MEGRREEGREGGKFRDKAEHSGGTWGQLLRRRYDHATICARGLIGYDGKKKSALDDNSVGESPSVSRGKWGQSFISYHVLEACSRH